MDWNPKNVKIAMNMLIDRTEVDSESLSASERCWEALESAVTRADGGKSDGDGGESGADRSAHSPSNSSSRSWVQTCNLVVFDGFFDEAERRALLDFVTEPDWDHAKGPGPASKWERKTSDGMGNVLTWGVSDAVLSRLAEHASVKAVLTRLSALYPEADVRLQPPNSHFAAPAPCRSATRRRARAAAPKRSYSQCASTCSSSSSSSTSSSSATPSSLSIDGTSTKRGRSDPAAVNNASASATAAAAGGAGDAEEEEEEEEEEEDEGGEQGQGYECMPFVVNATTYGDNFDWHVDADPSSFPRSSAFAQRFGTYVNHTPGKPLLVTALLYLDGHWRRNWDAETFFLDPDSDTGVFVRPKPYRMVLMDQDITHRASTPSALAGKRPRYSLAIKLVFYPKATAEEEQGRGGRGGGSDCGAADMHAKETKTSEKEAGGAVRATPSSDAHIVLSIARPEWGPPTRFGSAHPRWDPDEQRFRFQSEDNTGSSNCCSKARHGEKG